MSDSVIVLVPDIHVDLFPAELWTAEAQWIVDNAVAQNIVAVIGLGDNVTTPSNENYDLAKAGWDIIDAADIPYIMAIGNHDYENSWDARTVTQWDAHFGVARFSGKSYYGGAYNNSTENWYTTLTVGAYKYLFLALEYFPRDAAIVWAQSILTANPDYRVIIATHGYLNPNGTRTLDDDESGPGEALDANNGQDIWDNLVKLNNNIFLVVCGHQLTPTPAYSLGVENNIRIAQLFMNYQGVSATTGKDRIGLLTLQYTTNTIDVKTYSPYLEEYYAPGALTMEGGSMANTKWIPYDSGGGLTGTGNINDANHWDAGIVDVSKGAIFDTASFNGASQVVTINATTAFALMDWTGAGNNPTLTISGLLRPSGNTTFIPAMTINGASSLNSPYSGTWILTTGGVVVGCAAVVNAGTGTLSLGDNLTCLQLGISAGVLTTNNHNIVCTIFDANGGAGARTLNFGSSHITCTTRFSFTTGTTTVNAGTSVIEVSGTGGFAGHGGTYYIVNISGATETLTGNNTMNTLGLMRADVQTITFTDGSTQTVANLTRDNGTAVKTLQGSGASGWNLALSNDFQYLDYVSISNCTVTPAYRLIIGPHSTDGGGNVGLLKATEGGPYVSARLGYPTMKYNAPVSLTKDTGPFVELIP